MSRSEVSKKEAEYVLNHKEKKNEEKEIKE